MATLTDCQISCHQGYQFFFLNKGVKKTQPTQFAFNLVVNKMSEIIYVLSIFFHLKNGFRIENH